MKTEDVKSSEERVLAGRETFRYPWPKSSRAEIKDRGAAYKYRNWSVHCRKGEEAAVQANGLF